MSYFKGTSCLRIAARLPYFCISKNIVVIHKNYFSRSRSLEGKKRFLVKIRWDTNQKIFLNPRISRQNQQTNRDNMHTDHQKYLNHWIMQGSKCGAPHPPKLKDILTYGDSYAISRILSLCTKWYLINYLMHCTLLSSLCKVRVRKM